MQENISEDIELTKCVYCGNPVIDSTVSNVCQDCVLDPRHRFSRNITRDKYLKEKHGYHHGIRFLVGEEGPERVDITPIKKGRNPFEGAGEYFGGW